MKVIFKIFSVFILLFICQKVFAISKDSTQKFSVDVDIIAKNKLPSDYASKMHTDLYFVIINLTNTQDSIIHLRFMTCAWDASFITNNDSIYFPFWDCNANFPIEIILEPHKSISFYAELYSHIININEYDHNQPKFKIGFVDLPYKIYGKGDQIDDKYLNNFDNWNQHRIDKNSYKIYWSNDIPLLSKLHGYKIEE